MKLVVFGLSVSSSWGNGHATLWRGLIRALGRAGHRVVFFEKDQPFYRQSRDLRQLAGGELILYAGWEEIRPRAERELADAEVAMVTSYCPDATAACEQVLSSRARVRAFYDLDTPVTLARLEAGEQVEYLPPRGLGDFDLVLSFTGGRALSALRERLGARRVVPLYGGVDPAQHRPVPPGKLFAGDLSYLGTYAANRQQRLERLFLAPAKRLPKRRFILAGPLYPQDFPWQENVYYFPHVAPDDHRAFYCSSPLTLNVTRGPMAKLGYCPSGRLFEAAACGVAVLSDPWPGMERFFVPGEELLVADNAEAAVDAVCLPREVLARIGMRARERALAEHTTDQRARALIAALEGTTRREPAQVGC